MRSRRAGSGSNASGGVLGGISTGQDILVSMALKPTSSIRLPGDTVDEEGEPVEVVTTGRHDPCVGLRATPIGEAMLAIVLMDHYLRHRAQNADVRPVTPAVEAGSHPQPERGTRSWRGLQFAGNSLSFAALKVPASDPEY